MADGRVNVIVQNQEGRSPANDLDFQMMMIDGKWGGSDLNEDLRNRLYTSRWIRMAPGSEIHYMEKVDGQWVEKNRVLVAEEIIETKEFLWGELSFYTRDFRLANLNDKDYVEARHYTLLAADLIRMNMKKAFTVCLTRVITILELSQSRGGFLRKLLGIQHKIEEHREIPESPSLILPKRR